MFQGLTTEPMPLFEREKAEVFDGILELKVAERLDEDYLTEQVRRRDALLVTYHFCPSCHQKPGVEFGECLCGEVLKRVPHRHFVFSLPKILRRYFLYGRSLLPERSRCAGEALRVFFREAVPQMMRSLGCLRPFSRNVCHSLSRGNLRSVLMERSKDLV